MTLVVNSAAMLAGSVLQAEAVTWLRSILVATT
jgi:hypothetical protein